MLRDAYLTRLGLEAEPPSVEALFRIHRAHVERIPYETVWIHMGDRWTVDASNSVARIATGARGGYCFHLNGGLSELLRSLGYDVVRHVGGVHGPDGPIEWVMTNHLVLTVNGLPTEPNPGGIWYVDAGLGDGLYEPLPLRAGEYDQAPFRFRLEPASGEFGDWHFADDPAGSFSGMTWRSESTGLDAFAPRNEYLQTSPESGFVKVMTVQRRDASGVDVLRGLVLSRVGANASTTTLANRGELAAALGDVFGIHLDAFAEDAQQSLWVKLHEAHERWLSAAAAEGE